MSNEDDRIEPVRPTPVSTAVEICEDPNGTILLPAGITILDKTLCAEGRKIIGAASAASH